MKFTAVTLFFCGTLLCSAAPQQDATRTEKKVPPVKTAPAKKSSGKKVADPAKKRRPVPPASVKISQYLPSDGDVTAALEQAIKTGTRKIIFDRSGAEYQLRPVNLRSNLELIFADNVKIQAIQPPVTGKDRRYRPPAPLFSGHRINRISFTGKGKTKISVMPGQQIFKFTNSNTLSFQDISFSGGRNACLFVSCFGVRLINTVFDNISGYAVNFTGGSWFTCMASEFRNIDGCAVTVTNDRSCRMPWVSIENCEFFNSVSGINFLPTVFTGVKAKFEKRPPRFQLRSCRFFNNSGTDAVISGNFEQGEMLLVNNTFSNSRNVSLELRDFHAKGIPAKLRDTLFSPDEKNPAVPLLISGTTDAPVSGINLSKTTVHLPANRRGIGFELKNPQGSIDGTLLIISPDGGKRIADLSIKQE